VADEQVAQAQLAAQPVQQLQHHGLHRDVERRGGLVEDQQPRLHGQRARDAHARLLPARELVRVARQQLQRQAHLLGHLVDARRGLGAAQPASSASGSAMVSRAV
jgi:hypothetical protein